MASSQSDTLILPLCVVVASATVLSARALWASAPVRKVRAAYFKSEFEPEPASASAAGADADAPAGSVAAHVRAHGGIGIFAFKTARLLGCLLLLSLAIASFEKEDGEKDETDETDAFALAFAPNAFMTSQFAMCLTYFYASVLAILSVAGSAKTSRVVVKHLNTVLLATFCVYFYRDVFPLATFTLAPMDILEGYILWAKVFTLFTVSVIIPLVIPRQYIPLDPKNPAPESTPEQTASILSLALYFFLDNIIFLGYRVPHLKFDQLPPLADYDYAENLKKRAFPHMDVFAGKKKRHIFFGIMWTYRWDFFIMAIMLVINGLSAFISPLGINRLLNYLEGSAQESVLKPWVWILLLLLGPILGSLSFQWFIFVATHVMAQSTAIITQLVFEHALRIRVKSETGDKKKDAPAPDSSEPTKKATANLLGRITNLVTSDLAHINEARNVLFLFILVPIQVVGSVIFLYQVLGWSAFVGMGVMVALFPMPGYVATLEQTAQEAMLGKTDARVQTVSETMNILRMVKMFGWEKQMNAKIADKREDELNKLWTRRLLELLSGNLNFVIPVLTMLTTYATYVSELVETFFLILTLQKTIIAKQELSSSKVFSSMAVFDLLRNQMFFTFYCISMAVNGKVSLDRLNDFLHNTELLDSFVSKDTPEMITTDEPASDLIGFRDATFAWSNDEVDGTVTPSRRRFLLKVEGQLFFKPGCINLVVGPTGSGKTSLLMALLGEMHFVQPSLSSWYNLPREKGVSYAAQESWVLNDTIKNNILFNTPLDEERYKKVLYQCCLERDLDMWKAGDETEVGEKGLTLSGGQKARITLARAIYSNTEIVLLDDILAALDVHTAKWIVDKCLRGDLIENRTVILVTHNVALTSQLAAFVVSLGLDGRVRSQGSISDALAKDELLAKEVSRDREILVGAEKEIDGSPAADDAKKDSGKLIVEEEVAIGHVGWSALKLYIHGMGGAYTVSFFTLLMLGFVASEAGFTLQTWYLGYWASQYGQGEPVAVYKYLGTFSTMLLISMIIFGLNFILYTVGSFRASRVIHRQLVKSVLGTTLRWLDVTPTSRIIARCTVDITAVDDFIPEGLRGLLALTIAMLTKFSAVVIFAPIFFFGGALVGIVGAVCGRIYMASQLSVKREMSNAKAPVLAHFGATMAGLTSVRAYGAQETSIQISINKINRLTRAQRTFANLNRWVTVRIDVMGGLFAASLAYYVVYYQTQRPFNIGFSLNMAIGFAEMILYWVRVLNQFEIQGNSLERIQQYLVIEQEPKPTASGVPPAYWPASGSLSVDKLCAKYSPDGEEVLQGVSFNIKSGERVGVVGRTGSGKSSLTLALLRLILTEGAVYYDGIQTSSLNLDALRAAITIIPQVPELLVGSLRSNLDLFSQFDDVVLNGALRAAGLTALQAEMAGDDEGRLSLDTEIAAGGANLSVGQRQIIALARAIVRGSKLLILDEATSAIDYKTDAVIQASLRTELPPDTTILTVAHRLQTIMDADKIMVLDAGRIAEFDSPKVLLHKKDGMLRALVDESGDRKALYKMAGATA